MGVKHCSSCNLDKSLDFFGKDKWSKTGYSDYCKECRNRDARERAARRPDGYKARNERHKEKRREYYSKPENKRKYRSQFLQRSFGITVEDYDVMFDKQNGLCAICKGSASNSRVEHFAVDHCHTTGKIRGLLCDKCNRGIGLLQENLEVLNSAITYLRENV